MPDRDPQDAPSRQSLVRNVEQDRLPSTLTLEEFGQAMAALDLSAVPPPKRLAAIKDHLARIMAATLTDRALAHDVHISRQLHRLPRH